MRLLPTGRFRRDYEHLSPDLQDRTDHALDQLLANPRHPALHFKKMQGTGGVWELRVTQGYRLTLQIEQDLYVLRRVGMHDILRHP